jgi:hypothetical protein
MPVEAVETSPDPACKLLQTSDHQLQAARGLVRRDGSVPFRLQPR